MPLKQIACLLNGDRQQIVPLLRSHMQAIEQNESALAAIKMALQEMLGFFGADNAGMLPLDLAQQDLVEKYIQHLSVEKHRLPKEKAGMEKEMMEKQNSGCIVLLPPCTVAAYQVMGTNPEEMAGERMDAFICAHKLYEKKPDARLFGFNNPAPKSGKETHGYEEWLTAPDDREIPPLLTKKRFSGGLYAVYTIRFPDFQKWDFCLTGPKTTRNTRPIFATREVPNGCMEEYLNAVYSTHIGWPQNGIDGQVDLLLPIQRRQKK